MILLIDNYDSFSYNVYQLLGTLDPHITVLRNDSCTVEAVSAMGPEAIVISPGPGRPSEAGICEQIVEELGGSIPILGICLGHQAICEALGADITYARRLMHGKACEVRIDPSSLLFAKMPAVIRAGRYHSLAVAPETLPASLKVTATADDGEIMAVEDRERLLFGLQFHPESILTPEGGRIIENFLHLAKSRPVSKLDADGSFYLKGQNND
jgi:anthranilate synthase component 2